eukprot:m.173385 g.173385  ORF g.173385 m.173385 type:complete len:453 (-) comp14586_c0_seq1:507-1865(-)
MKASTLLGLTLISLVVCSALAAKGVVTKNKRKLIRCNRKPIQKTLARKYAVQPVSWKEIECTKIKGKTYYCEAPGNAWRATCRSYHGNRKGPKNDHRLIVEILPTATRIYVSFEYGNVVRGLSANTGEELWRYDATVDDIQSFGGYDPNLDRVYYMPAAGGVRALYGANGTVAWELSFTGGWIYGGLDVYPATGEVLVADQAGGEIVTVDVDGNPTTLDSINVDTHTHVVVAGTDAVYTSNAADKEIYCSNLVAGTVTWTQTLDGRVSSRTAVSTSLSKVFVRDITGKAYSLSLNDGTIIDTYLTDADTHYGGLALNPSDTVLIFGNDDGTVYALDPSDMTEIWTDTVTVGGAITTVPVFSPDGATVYIGAYDGVHAFNVADGTVLWSFTDPSVNSGFMDGTPAVVPESGNIIVPGEKHTYCLAPQGTLVWSTVNDSGAVQYATGVLTNIYA